MNENDNLESQLFTCDKILIACGCTLLVLLGVFALSA